jgi:hypothetical protein
MNENKLAEEYLLDEYDEFVDYEDPRWVQRDRKVARHSGMQVDGRSIFTLVAKQVDRAKGKGG